MRGIAPSSEWQIGGKDKSNNDVMNITSLNSKCDFSFVEMANWRNGTLCP
ncbi:hypothetical protein [Flavobacterium succinicans]|nr:hypothetical protein [Flavobacterium succinicans]